MNMRTLFSLFFCLCLHHAVGGQSLLEFDAASGDLNEYVDLLDEFMTGSGNDGAEDAFANFSGVFFGGGFDEARQRRIAATTQSLALARIKPSSGMISYLGALEGMTAAPVPVPEGGASPPPPENEVFDGYHDALDQLLRREDATVNMINRVLAGTEVFINDRRFTREADGTGWLVFGGKTRFGYGDKFYGYVDTAQYVIGVGQRDTIKVTQTDLRIDFAEKEVYGKGGRTDWQRVGLNEDVFAILVSYTFDFGRMIYTADSAQLQYPEYFDNRILTGTFSDKVMGGGAKSGRDYPQFLSDDGYVEINNVGEGIELAGNFELRGGTVYAIGSKGRRAKVNLRVSGTSEDQSVVGLADRFIVRQGEAIGGEGVETKVFVGRDSLYHPSVTLSVDIPQRVVTLRRTSSSADQGPFQHSLNNMAIYAQQIDVYVAGDSAVVGRKTVSFQEKDDVVFESKDYFSRREYDFMQDIARSNPLEIIHAYRYGPQGGNDIIDGETLARQFDPRYKSGDITNLLYNLQSRGFVLYDAEEDLVTLQPKLQHYVRASREEIDYDKLRIVSQTDGTNATLDLKTGQIRVDAAQIVELNREKEIAIKPLGDQLLIQGDRDFDFDGKIFAGGMVFEGKDFHFKYAPYHVKMDSVRYLDLFLPVDDFIGEGMKRESTGSRIEHLSGYLLIDAPKNKSGSEDIAYFPSLQSKDVSYIYYDRADTSANYPRDEFFFELQPFSLNGMDSLLAGEVELDGRLVSGGIFPDMEETLSVQEDGSLGFVTQTAEGGQATYGDRGNYQGEVVLSNRGLEGKGELRYLESDIISEDLKFGLKKTTGSSEQFALEESVEGSRVIPQVKASAVNIEFIPYGDSLVVRSAAEAPFEMFKAGAHELTGKLVLTPDALRGAGKLDWAAADMQSNDMSFTTFGAMADTSDVSIKSLEGDDRLALKTTNVESKIDFATQKANFQNNSTDLSTELPYNQFKTSVEQFEWDMAGNTVTFQAKPGKDRFTSTHPDQDALTFVGEDAVYDINTSILTVDGVPVVKSADAFIYPGDGKIVVEGGANIQELQNARIVADTSNEYHVINRATVRLNGRKDYTASGFYEYNVGSHTQEVEFQRIVGQRIGKGKRDEKATETRAEGTVEEGRDFYIDDKTKFYGTIDLTASAKTLRFEGFAKIDADKLPGAQWFTINSDGDRKNLTLEVREPKDREGMPLFTGLYLSKPNRQIYPSFVQSLDFRKDHAILDANGLFTYDQKNDVFMFGDSARLANPDAHEGNLLMLDNASGKVSGSGRLGLGGRLKYNRMQAYGTVAMDMPTVSRRPPEPEPTPEPKKDEEEKKDEPPSMFLLEEETTDASEPADSSTEKTSITIAPNATVAPAYPPATVEAMLAIDLILPNKLTNLMTNDILAGSAVSPGLNVVTDNDFYQAGIKTLFPEGKERAQALDRVRGGVFAVDRKINEHSFLFTRAKLTWSSDYQSFVSTEKLTGLASIRGNTINKMMDVRMEIKMPTGGEDRLYLYVKTANDIYYWFGFKDGILNVASNNTQFMGELDGMKAKDLIMKMDDGETYEILPVSPSTVQTWLRRHESAF